MLHGLRGACWAWVRGLRGVSWAIWVCACGGGSRWLLAVDRLVLVGSRWWFAVMARDGEAQGGAGLTGGRARRANLSGVALRCHWDGKPAEACRGLACGGAGS